MKKAPICICVPCQQLVHAGFWVDQARLTGYWTRRFPDHEIILVAQHGTILVRQRHMIAEQALKAGASHLFWIDSDMRFPHDALERMLAHDKDIVVANYITRGGELTPTARTLRDEPMFTHEHSTGLEEALQCGFGLALIRREVFEEMDRPWFAIPWDTDREDFIGEDVFWCNMARRSGFNIFVDHDVSKAVRHCGNLEYHHVHAEQQMKQKERQGA